MILPVLKKIFNLKSFLTTVVIGGTLLVLTPLARLYAQPLPPAPTLQGNVAQQGLQGMGNQMATNAQNEQENILIILDASYSMAEPIAKNFSKMAAAKRTVLQTLQKIPDNRPVGLRVYGQSRTEYSSCRATKLLVPIGFNNRFGISRELLKVQPTGATPISHALQTALTQDFAGIQGKKSIVLVSDGIETCSVDPCAVAVKMMQTGADVKINVVGYGLHDYEAEKQLKCVALATKGKYYNASTEAELASSLDELFKTEKNVQAQLLTPKPTMPDIPVNPRLQKHRVQ